MKLKRKEEKVLKKAKGKLKKPTKIEQSDSGVTVIVDLAFENLMTDKEISSTVNQMQYAYADNRRKPLSLDLHGTSVVGKIKETFEQRAPDYLKWRVKDH